MQEELSLPAVSDIRERILTVQQEEYRICLQASYLFATRISELIAKATPHDNTVARGPKGIESRLDTISGHRTAIFTLHGAKRKGKIRIIALPFKYEPWVRPVYDYFQSWEDEPVFPFTRQKIGRAVRQQGVFKGLQYPIEAYTAGPKGFVRHVERHPRPFALHALRHLRATELVRFYHFTATDLAAYCGWRLRTVQRDISSVMERYIDLRWQEYYPKLLRKR
jgi:hypothetical protein